MFTPTRGENRSTSKQSSPSPKPLQVPGIATALGSVRTDVVQPHQSNELKEDKSHESEEDYDAEEKKLMVCS